MERTDQYYTEEGFWHKLKTFGLTLGEGLVDKSLILYYVGVDPNTPKWAKTVVFSALGYLIWPLDAIPDGIPVAGFADDAGALVAALASIAACVTDEHTRKAKVKLKDWFGSVKTKTRMPTSKE